jgi:hypothetical protein
MPTPLSIVYRKPNRGQLSRPSRYDKCPGCGAIKMKISKWCRYCQPVERAAVQQPSDPSYRIIPLTKGQVTLVDTKFYDWLLQWNWHAWWNKGTKSYYATRGIKNVGTVYMHREILGLPKGDKRDGDHTNHDTLDNRLFIGEKEQLRIATRQENSWNQRIKQSNKTGYKWVFRDRNGLYRYSMRRDGKRMQVTGFSTPEDAYNAACIAAAHNHRQFAKFD